MMSEGAQAGEEEEAEGACHEAYQVQPPLRERR